MGKYKSLEFVLKTKDGYKVIWGKNKDTTEKNIVPIDTDIRILSLKPAKQKYLFHASPKRFSILDPQKNKNTYGEGGYEFGSPVVFARAKPTDDFCKVYSKDYLKVRKNISGRIYHNLIYKGRTLHLGSKHYGYIYVLEGFDFFEMTYEILQLGKWNKYKEWISFFPVRPIERIKIKKPFEWDKIQEYEFVGKKYVGKLPAKKYLKLVKENKVKKAVSAWIKNETKKSLPVELKKYIK
ncbi:MAG: hypothetical protein U0469_00550 [Candidatus Paceibacterota bacterium]|jgi:hypothetical protein